MSWYKLDEDHKFVIISICIVLILVEAVVQFFIANPYWILFFNIAELVVVLYLMYLWFIYAIGKVREEIWRKFQKEAERIKEL